MLHPVLLLLFCNCNHIRERCSAAQRIEIICGNRVCLQMQGAADFRNLICRNVQSANSRSGIPVCVICIGLTDCDLCIHLIADDPD